MAFAKALNLPVSTKHSIEISNHLRYKKTAFAKSFLEDVIGLKKAVPFKTFNNNVGHKPGMAAGRYPQKAAKEFLSLIKSVEANAQMKGLNSSNLKITKLLANKASEPMTGGRHRRGTKRTHLEIEVKELVGKKEKRVQKEKSETKPAEKEVKEPTVEKSPESVKEAVPEVKEELKVEEKPVVEKKEIVKEAPARNKVSEGSKNSENFSEPKEVEVKKEEPKEVEVKKEEVKEVIPEVAKETEVVKKEVPKQEVEVKKEEPKAVEVKKEEPKEVIPEVKEEPKSESKPQEEVAQKQGSEASRSRNAKHFSESDISDTAENGKKVEALEDMSPADLLKKAQEKAAQLNKKEKVDKKTEKEVGEVENLFEKLKQKGSLRDQNGGKKQ